VAESREDARLRRSLAQLRRSVLARPSVRHAIALGAAAYGVSESRMRSVAMCESGLRPAVAGAGGTYQGLYQFGTTLWGQTPYRAFSRTDPYAASFAASWAFSRGMSGHWPVCGR
jgi:hypothetical protein